MKEKYFGVKNKLFWNSMLTFAQLAVGWIWIKNLKVALIAQHDDQHKGVS